MLQKCAFQLSFWSHIYNMVIECITTVYISCLGLRLLDTFKTALRHGAELFCSLTGRTDLRFLSVTHKSFVGWNDATHMHNALRESPVSPYWLKKAQQTNTVCLLILKSTLFLSQLWFGCFEGKRIRWHRSFIGKANAVLICYQCLSC